MEPGVFSRITIACCSLVLLGGCSVGRTKMFDDVSSVDLNTSVAAARLKSKPVSNRRIIPMGSHTKASPAVSSFVQQQLRFSRVRTARESAEEAIEEMFLRRNIAYPAAEVYLRVFKHERDLEVWVRPFNSDRFELLHTYPICALAGSIGPKRVRGDKQVPEGFYNIDLFNPNSSYHLSMRVDYPNARDRAANTTGGPLGGDIYIHGGCASVGCVAITDQGINELYWLSVNARGFGQEKIPVHIFPARMDGGASKVKKVQRNFRPAPPIVAFWETLRPGYEYFEKTRKVPHVVVDEAGRYRVVGALKASQPSQRLSKAESARS